MYPPVAFHFQVIFKGLNTSGATDSGFQSVTGLEAYLNTDKTVHQDLAKPGNESVSFSTLVLKRAVKDINDSPLTQWIFSWIDQTATEPLPELCIQLLDEEHQPYMSWTVTNVIPKSWKLGELNAEKSEILFEIIELSYSKLKFDRKEGK